MKLSTRIGIGVFSLVALMTVAGAYQLSVIDGLQQENLHLVETSLETGRLGLRIRRQLAELIELTEKFRVLRDPEYAEELERRRAETGRLIASTRRPGLSPAELEQAEALATLWAGYDESAPRAEARILEWSSATRLDAELARLEEMRSVVTRLMEVSELGMSARASASARRAERARWVSLVAWIVGLVAAAATSVIVVRSIASSLRRLQDGTHSLGKGNLAHRVQLSGPPEFSSLAADFNSMAGRLEELEHLQRDFVSMVSHELKAPLASMQETLDLVLDGSLGPLNGEQQRILTLNKASATRLSGMIHDLLDLACLEAGAMEFVLQEHDLCAMARAVLEEFEHAIRARKIHLKRRLPDEPLAVWADPRLLRQVLENLVSNAIKFTPERGTIEVELHRLGDGDPAGGPANHALARSGPLVRMTVSDSGSGIPDDHKERVFGRFHRVDTDARGSQGTGLGLAIARGIVAGHGGDIRVEDRSGGGSTFAVLLPVKAPGDAENRKEIRFG